MDSLILTLACNLYDTSPEALIPLTGGHYNSVYQFPHDDKFAILRIGQEDRPTSQTLGMMEWVRFLSTHGAPVCAPVLSINHHLIESLTYYGTRYILTAFEKVEGSLAETIPPSAWTPDLFQSLGRSVGKFHSISATYVPNHPHHTQPLWFDFPAIHQAMDQLTLSSIPACDKLASLIDELRELPTNSADFGMIHDDLHFANFLIQPDGAVTIIDFDDCVYGWFAMDIAMALFDGLVLYNAPSDGESQEFARRFLSNYLSGYRQEYVLPQFWQQKIPKFLKLIELTIYANLIDHADIAKPGTWVGNFMRGRAKRISDDVPYVDTNFGG